MTDDVEWISKFFSDIRHNPPHGCRVEDASQGGYDGVRIYPIEGPKIMDCWPQLKEKENIRCGVFNTNRNDGSELKRLTEKGNKFFELRKNKDYFTLWVFSREGLPGLIRYIERKASEA